MITYSGQKWLFKIKFSVARNLQISDHALWESFSIAYSLPYVPDKRQNNPKFHVSVLTICCQFQVAHHNPDHFLLLRKDFGHHTSMLVYFLFFDQSQTRRYSTLKIVIQFIATIFGNFLRTPCMHLCYIGICSPSIKMSKLPQQKAHTQESKPVHKFTSITTDIHFSNSICSFPMRQTK